MLQAPEILISVVTCFHNSATRLSQYFSALSALDTARASIEFVFVDNASTDDTLVQLRDSASGLPQPTSVIFESQPGLMFARCAGVLAARGRFILFLDDDNEPYPDYISELLRLIGRFPDAAIFTGNVLLPKDYPGYLRARQNQLGMLAVRERSGEFAFPLDSLMPEVLPWGAGLFASRDSLTDACSAWRAGDMQVVGRRGNSPTGGEDVWLAHYITRRGQAVVFSDRLRISHRIAMHRFEPEYIARLGFENGVSFVTILQAVKQLKPSIGYPPLGLGRLLRLVMLSLPFRVLQAIITVRYDALHVAAIQLGLALSLISQHAQQSFRKLARSVPDSGRD